MLRVLILLVLVAGGCGGGDPEDIANQDRVRLDPPQCATPNVCR